MTEANGVNGPEANAAAENAGAGADDNRTILDGSGTDGSIPALGDLVAGLSPENRTLVEAKKWATLDDAFKSHRELETHASKALVPPGKDATAEDWSNFYEKLGRPEKPEGYELKVARKTLPEDFPYDETLSVEFRNMAHEAGLTPQQAQIVHDKFVGRQAEAFKATQQSMAEKAETAHRDLVKEFGDPDTDGYKQGVELMSRAARQLGLVDTLSEIGMIGKDGSVLNAKMAKALARIGKDMFSEDSFASGDGAALDNPFSDKTFNLTKQGQLVRSDPNKARALIRAAGEDPGKYGL
jgi:hypothetical protein